jgi:hypothetical protein
LQPARWDHKAGLVDLRRGKLEDPAYHDWLFEKVNCVFVNNFNHVFGERSEPKKGAITVDSRIAAMFARMKPGSIMVTLNPIQELGLALDEVLSFRKIHNLDTPKVTDASFFTMEKIYLGLAKDSVSWSEGHASCTEEIYVYKYTRQVQPGHEERPFFLCTNSSVGNGGCDLARNATPISAIKEDVNDGLVIQKCECKFEAYQIRKRSSKISYKL